MEPSTVWSPGSPAPLGAQGAQTMNCNFAVVFFGGTPFMKQVFNANLRLKQAPEPGGCAMGDGGKGGH